MQVDDSYIPTAFPDAPSSMMDAATMSVCPQMDKPWLVPTYTYPVGCDPPKINGGIVEGGGTAATICAIVVAAPFTAKLAGPSRALDVVDSG
jgi:hypothetical protein